MSGHTDLAPLPLLNGDITRFVLRVAATISWSLAVTHGYERMLRRGEPITAETLDRLAKDTMDTNRR